MDRLASHAIISPVSRLYDRLLADGVQPYGFHWAAPGLQQPGAPLPTATAANSLVFNEGLSDVIVKEGTYVFDITDAAQYVSARTLLAPGTINLSPSGWEGFFGVLRPPFDRCFLEFQATQWLGGTGHAGWLVETEEAAAGRETNPAPDWLQEARWFVTMSLFIEPRRGTILGPCIAFTVPLGASGEPLPSRDGGSAPVAHHLPPMEPKPNDDQATWLQIWGLNLAFPAYFALSLMNCRNVETCAVAPPPKLSRKHERKRGRPLVTYHVLEIEPMRRILDSEGEARTKGLQHALHICRGHFKTYTEEAPLLGRHVGTYWWPSHVRGKAEEGVVEKDYRVRLDSGDLGQTYREADEDATVAPAKEPVEPDDPDTRGRGLRAHNLTQNALAHTLRQAGFVPRSPRRGEPDYDLAWEDGDVVWVAEVKSITKTTEERQLRIAIGQVLRYRQQLGQGGRTVRALVAIESAPYDKSWIELCGEEGIALVWPDVMTEAIRGVSTDSAP